MDSIDQILYINLEHRNDRKLSLLQSLNSIGIDNNKIQRINAVLFSLCGHIGCGKSHVNALDYAIKNNWNTVMILEDDFVFTQSKEYINDIVSRFPTNYDIVLLHGDNTRTKDIKINGIHKLNYCISSSGYIIKKHYMQTLKSVFETAIVNMNILFDKHVADHKLKGKIIPKMIWNKYAIDRSWHQLMKQDNFYLCVPHLGKQSGSCSDNLCSIDKQYTKIKLTPNKQTIENQISQHTNNQIKSNIIEVKKYHPSLELLKKIITKKNQTTSNYKFMIILRQHLDESIIIDQIIAIMLAHFNNDIFIGISIAKQTKISTEFESLCNYIKFTSAFDTTSAIGDFMLVAHGIKYFKHINAKYILWHSASEYYCKQIEKDFEITYTKKIVKTGDNNIVKLINELPANWMWWRYLKKNDKMIKYFVDNNIIPYHDQINGLCIRKDIMMDFLNTLEPYNPIPNICFQEMGPLSYLKHHYDYDKFCLTNIFWADQKNILKRHAENIKNNKFDYYVMKRIDQNNGLLEYLHKNFVEPRLIDLNLI